MARTIIAHHNDNDGRCAAALYCMAERLSLQDPDVVLLEVSYGKPLPDVLKEVTKKDKVVILDFSFDKDTMLSLANSAKSLLWIDHHLSAMEVVEPLSLCDNVDVIFNPAQCGALITYNRSEYFGVVLDSVVDYVDDRDRFVNKIPESLDFFNGTINYDWKSKFKDQIEFWTALLVDVELVDEVLSLGKAFTKQTQEICERIVSKKQYRVINTTFGEKQYTVAVYNRTDRHTDVGAAIYTAEPSVDFVLGYCILEDGKMSLAGRASKAKTDAGVNVGRLLKDCYKGGGHPGAGGAALDMATGLLWLADIYQLPDLAQR